MKHRLTLVRRTSAWADCSIWRAWERGRSEQANPLPLTMFPHASQARVANSISIPFCDVQVLSTFAFCALRTRLGCRPHRHSTRTAHISGSWRLSQVRCCRRFHRNPRIAPHSVCPASNARVPGHWHHHRRVSGALAPPSKGIMSLLRRTS
jgi:hypothetical protein